MKIIYFLLLGGFMLNIEVCSGQQQALYARTVVDQLCSPLFAGRGYVEQGEKLAATWIAQEYQKIGLLNYDSGYFQKFSLTVNTFPNQMLLKINGKPLVPGKDFLVGPSSPSIEGVFDVVVVEWAKILESETITTLRQGQNQLLVIDQTKAPEWDKTQKQSADELLKYLKFSPDINFAGILILSNEKLTWAGAVAQTPRPILEVSGEVMEETIQQVEVDIDAQLIDEYATQNVVGYLPGETYPDSSIVIMAHYDHLGKMGRNTFFPGANDNASGVAMLLSLAKYYQESDALPYSLVFIATGAEEVGLQGSRFFVEHPLIALAKIKLLYNFDLAGTGEEGIQVVNGAVYPQWFALIERINEEHSLLHQIKIRGEACNSDHCFFYQKGVPSLYSYTLGGTQAYHDIYDRPNTLPLNEFQDYFDLISIFLNQVMKQ